MSFQGEAEEPSRSYEIYLTRMFAVLALVAVLYAEPMNRLRRHRTGLGPSSLSAAVPEVG